MTKDINLKLENETALAKIKVLVSKRYENLGRGQEDINSLDEELIDSIDDVLYNTDIDIKKVIIERLELDKIYEKVSEKTH